MNKSKFQSVIIVGLLSINFILFGILLKPHQRNEGPKAIISEKLHFDEVQIKNYKTYIQLHREDVNENELILKRLRSTLYEQLKNNQQDTVKVDSLIAIIANQQMAAERINYNHFLEIKKLCTPSQLKDFDELTTEIAHLFSPKERK